MKRITAVAFREERMTFPVMGNSVAVAVYMARGMPHLALECEASSPLDARPSDVVGCGTVAAAMLVRSGAEYDDNWHYVGSCELGHVIVTGVAVRR